MTVCQLACSAKNPVYIGGCIVSVVGESYESPYSMWEVSCISCPSGGVISIFVSMVNEPVITVGVTCKE